MEKACKYRKAPRVLKYNYNFIGLVDDGKPNNFIKFDPVKSYVWIRIRINPQDWRPDLERSGLKFEPFDDKLWLKVTAKNFGPNKELITQIFRAAIARDEAA